MPRPRETDLFGTHQEAGRGPLDAGQSAEESDRASGCESSGFDPSPSPTPQRGGGRGSRLSPSSSFSGEESTDPAATGGRTATEEPEALQLGQTLTGKRTGAAAAGNKSSSSKASAGTPCLAPRRLRSKAPPRVAWVSGKFIRQLGTDEHRTAQLPRFASFVYSVCHVEGYDIQAVHRDAVQKHVRCRFMNDERSALMLEVDDCLHLADPKARSQEAFEATCGLHNAPSGGSQLEGPEALRSVASAVVAGHDEGPEADWGWQSFPPDSHSMAEYSTSAIPVDETSSEIDAGAAGGARSLRMGMRALSASRSRHSNINVTLAFIFESGPVVLWIAAADMRAKDSRGRRELLSSFLFFLSQFATRFVRADMVQEDVMRFAYIQQVRKTSPSFQARLPHQKISWKEVVSVCSLFVDRTVGACTQIPKSRIHQDCIYLKTESVAEKLAASFALGQSIRLSVYESLINFTIARVRAIPEHMARFGLADEEAPPSSSSAVWASLRQELRRPPVGTFSTAAIVQPLAWSRLCGDLLGKIVDVNIVQDFRDVPEYFWNDDTWQHFWRRVIHEFLLDAII